MTSPNSKQGTRVRGAHVSDSTLPMTQPDGMKTASYISGAETLDGNDAWSLFVACAAGDRKRAHEMLTKDRRLANAQYWYQFPIHMAVRAGNARIVKLLLRYGADPGQSNFTYNSWDKLLRIARERGYREVEDVLQGAMAQRFQFSPEFDGIKDAIIARNPGEVRALLRRRPELAMASDSLGNSGLHWSVITHQLELLKRFHDSGTPIDGLRADGQTPILLAVNGGNDYWYRDVRGRSHPSIRNSWVMVGQLLALGASYTISVAAAVGDQERVEELLREDPACAKRLDSSRASPLSYASYEGYIHIVQQLLEHGADPNLPEVCAPRGRALFEACSKNNIELADLLLRHGADPNAGVDSCGCCLTIVKHFHPHDYKPLQSLLRKYGAYSPPYDMSSAEMRRAMRDRHEVIRDDEFFGNLLAKNDPSLIDSYLKAIETPPDCMMFHGGVIYPRLRGTIQKLLARGLDPNGPDWLGKTYLHSCAERGDIAAATLFLDAGADINAREIEYHGTPLATTVRHGRSDSDTDHAATAKRAARMVSFLLKRGAATNLPGDEPWATPMAWAKKLGLREIQSILERHRAKP